MAKAFSETLAAIESADLLTRLKNDLHTYVACLNVRELTRCGGSARDPQLIDVIETTLHDEEITAKVRIRFNDGSSLDCSGHCGGEVFERQERLIVTINRQNGKATWATTDGVVTGC